MAVQVVERPGPHMETAGLRRNRGSRLSLRETVGPPRSEGGEKVEAAFVIIPLGCHRADRREGRDGRRGERKFKVRHYRALFFPANFEYDEYVEESMLEAGTWLRQKLFIHLR